MSCARGMCCSSGTTHIHKAEIDKSVPYERIIIYLDRGHFERSMPGAGLFDSFELADKRSRHLLTPNAEQIEALKAAIAAMSAPPGMSFSARRRCARRSSSSCSYR